MHGTIHRLDVRPRLPPRLERLADFAGNLWYSWHRPTRSLFARLNPALWQNMGHSPKAFLRNIDQRLLDEAARDPAFVEAYDRVIAAYERYHAPPDPGFAPLLPEGDCVAYFCAEFGMHESLPIYSGGLGILAGDHCKTASDVRLPFVGVGLLYRQGYFLQTVDGDGSQHALYADTDFDTLPVEPAQAAAGGEVKVAVDLPGRRVLCRVWRARIGHVSLYLLDADVEENAAGDRDITHQLYIGSVGKRLEQEVLLGVGGARALAALGIAPTCWHVNEGHPAFLTLERIGRRLAQGLDFGAALEDVAASTVFTTHTPVAAGHDHFSEDAVRAHLARAVPELMPHLDAVLALGRMPDSADFNMTALAARCSRAQNGVSRIHGGVAANACAQIWPQVDPEENPLGYITNGVHVPTFLSDQWHDELERCIGRDWPDRLSDAQCWEAVRAIPDGRFWTIHQALKAQMLHLVRYRVRQQALRSDGSEAHLDRILKYADPDRPGVLTIGFGRRFATYKRATLMFERLDWLREIVSDPARPVLFLFTGKAHPADHPGQALIRRVIEVARMPEFEARILFIENYDLRVARRLVSGVDVWLNNPIYPMEACGTSGMKAAINGVLNLSVLDGWWDEGYNSRIGWAIKPAGQAVDPRRRDADEARTLYELLQDQVVPLYYERNAAGYSPGWVAMAKEAMVSVAPRFSSLRMLREYAERCYAPASARGRRMAGQDFGAAAALAQWKARVRAAWGGVRLAGAGPRAETIDYGGSLRVAVTATLNGLAPEDLVVEAVLARPGARHAGESLERWRLLPESPVAGGGECSYALEFSPRSCGRIELRVRAYPAHELLSHPFELGLMLWM
jgi:starch phosphorylase